jgi:hypothetical protein
MPRNGETGNEMALQRAFIDCQGQKRTCEGNGDISGIRLCGLFPMEKEGGLCGC